MYEKEEVSTSSFFVCKKLGFDKYDHWVYNKEKGISYHLKQKEEKMTNTTKMRIPKKYEPFINEVWYEGEDGYWGDLIECCICDATECHYIHEDTQKDFLKSVRLSIRVIDNEDEYVARFGVTDLEHYRRELNELKELGLV